jgi:hypothetical protein
MGAWLLSRARVGELQRYFLEKAIIFHYNESRKKSFVVLQAHGCQMKPSMDEFLRHIA